MKLKKKIVLIGDGAVGKTSLIQRYVLDEFSDAYLMTMGVKVMKKELDIEGVKLILMMWDVMGQDGYSSVHAEAMEDAVGGMIVCDITRKETLDRVMEIWLPRLGKAAGAVPLVFLGNKADLVDQAEFGLHELVATTEGLEAPCMLTSARTGLNVEQAFHTLGRMLLVKRLREGNPLEGVKQRDVRTAADAASLIRKDFCIKHGEVAIAKQILKDKFMETGTNPHQPHTAGLTQIVYLLHSVDKDLQGKEKADRNLAERLKVLGWVTERNPPRAILLSGPKASEKVRKARVVCRL